FQAVRRPSDNASNWVPILVTKSPSVVEIEPNDSAESATPVSTAPFELPILLHGTLARPKDRDYFALELKKGDRLFARAETKAINSAADVELIAVDATGREMQRVDDLNLPGGALDEAALTFNADKDGKYFLVVREATGASGAELSYRIDVQRVQPRITVVAEIASLAIPQDGYQSLPLTITRTDFTGPIELSLSGAPEGVTLEPNVVPEAANSLICRLQASASTPIGIRSFSIVARAKLPTSMPSMTPMPPPTPPAASPAKDAAAATGSAPTESYIETTVVAQPLVDKQFINVDLIRHALRDNQRWLPPSVKTQLALQITPPSPFRADPAEQIVTLPRYLQSPLVIRTPRDAAFTEPITFRSVGGGQFGDEAEGRRQMFARFPNATAADSQITATFHSRSQANDATERVDISATGRHGARSITLVRSITLNVRPAYELQFEPKQLTLAPGETAKVRLSVSRLPEFSGPVTVSSPTSPAPVGLNVPTMLTIAADQSAIDFEISAAADAKPRRDRLRFASNAPVGAFQEEPRPTELDVEIKMPPAAAPPAK
ncbi:MAG TPA: hypothetical protein PLV92_09865, partial [Pirellulaceae bacterium]|nr:hypothetical protein [Pirellulaceae bacterium]